MYCPPNNESCQRLINPVLDLEQHMERTGRYREFNGDHRDIFGPNPYHDFDRQFEQSQTEDPYGRMFREQFERGPDVY